MSILSSVGVLAALVTSTAAAPPESDPVEGRIDWVYDYAAGQRLAASSGKPMFVVFRCER
jgi:hypothetical protein